MLSALPLCFCVYPEEEAMFMADNSNPQIGVTRLYRFFSLAWFHVADNKAKSVSNMFLMFSFGWEM